MRRGGRAARRGGAVRAGLRCRGGANYDRPAGGGLGGVFARWHHLWQASPSDGMSDEFYAVGPLGKRVVFGSRTHKLPAVTDAGGLEFRS